LQNGVIESAPAAVSAGAFNGGSVSAASAAIGAAKKGGKDELVLYQKVSLGTGKQAGNPWLQELPDPVSKATWDNYALISVAKAKELNIDYDSVDYEYYPSKPVISIKAGNKELKLPVLVIPGMNESTIAVALGYGRTKTLGKAAEGVGQNAYPFVQLVNGTMMYGAVDVTVASAGETTQVAGTQIHHTLMGREIVKETNLENYKKNPKSGNHDDMLVTHSGVKKAATIDLWDEFDRPGHKWGMTIDLNSCIGCGNCVVSCTAENNVAVVGKAQVMNTREMHWLRIDRYYSSDMSKEVAKEEGVGAIDMYLDMENPAHENPKVVFQPIMCQHCNHAPCENVCPVLATNHSSDGLNQMTYNRCVGTRYCANNCPFKVRRFNWFNYNGNKDYAFNPAQDDLGRMVLNPDVVVRSRGVMEKCSMCVQRIQEGKLDAKKAEAPLKDGAIKTACQQSCPTSAIYFGDLNDANSEIAKLRKEEADGRNYFLLEELGVKPTVSYLTKVRNCEETIEEGKKTSGAHSEKKEHA